MTNAAFSKTRLLANLIDSGLSLLHGLNNLRSGCESSVDVSHSRNVGSWMVGRCHAWRPFLSEISHQELSLCSVFLNRPEGLVQFNFDQIKSLTVVLTDVVPFDHVKGNLQVFLNACFEHSRSQLASAFHTDPFQGCSAGFPVAL